MLTDENRARERYQWQRSQTGDTGACLYYTTFTNTYNPSMPAWFQTNVTSKTVDFPTVELMHLLVQFNQFFTLKERI